MADPAYLGMSDDEFLKQSLIPPESTNEGESEESNSQETSEEVVPEDGSTGSTQESEADPAYLGPLPHPQDQDTSVGAPGTQAGCLIDQYFIQVGTGFKLVQKAWVQGDYTATRR